MLKIKICGITNGDDARLAIDLGADFLGFVLAPSPRSVSPAAARRVIRSLPRGVETVGVVRDLPADAIRALRDDLGFAWVQLHGSETPETARLFYPRVIKAFSTYRHGIATFRPFAGAVLLLDRPKAGPAGRPGPFPRRAPRRGRAPSDIPDAFLRLARQARRYGKVLIAGGLDPGSVGEWVRRLRPWGVDVARGVEARPGRKDPALLRAFIEAARAAEARPQEPNPEVP
jgi:phosphoribosylanthranilate isomerase